jgi:hypothetical protein
MINWTIEDLQTHIEQINKAEKLVTLETEDELNPMYLLFKYPSKRTVQLADIEADRTARKAKKDKFLTEDQIWDYLRKHNIWTEEDDKKVEATKALIDMRQRKLEDPDISESSKPYIREAIEKYEQELFKIELKKERMLVNSAERRIRQSKYEYMAWACSYDIETDMKLWENYLTFCNSVSTELKNKTLSEFLQFLAGHTTEQIRYIARSNLWRINYISAQKSNTPLFTCSVIDLTPDQLNLIWWSSYYESIYQMLPDDQPDDEIIEDDAALDKYMADLHKARQQERRERQANQNYSPSSALRMKEVLVSPGHPDYQNFEYNKVNVKGKSNVVTLQDDPENIAARRKTEQAIQKSKRFTPPPKEE